MESKNWTYDRLFQYWMVLLVGVMLLYPMMIGLACILFLPVLILGIIQKEIRYYCNWGMIGLTSLYLAYIVGSIFTKHSDVASETLVHKLSLFIFPFAFTFLPKKKISLYPVLTAFVLGVLVLLIQSYSVMLYRYLGTGESQYLFSSFFSFQFHPTYVTAYYILAAGISVYGLRNQYRYYSKWWVIPFLGIIFLATVLSLSLSGILFLLLALAAAVLWWIYNRFGKWVSLGALVLTPVFLYLIVTKVPRIEGEWNNAAFYFEEYWKDPVGFVEGRPQSMSGSETRLVLWTVTAQIIKDHPMGMGTGNLEDEMTVYLQRWKKAEFAEHKYNPHNQYLQVAGEIGWIGLIILVLTLFWFTIYACRNGNWLLLLVTANLGFNMLFESMLQRQSGIVFSVFWMVMLSAIVHRNGKNEKNAQLK